MKKPPEPSLETRVSDLYSYVIALERMRNRVSGGRGLKPEVTYVDHGFEGYTEIETVAGEWRAFYKSTIEDRWPDLVAVVPEQFDEDPT